MRDGEPCSHKGCLSHISHPCQGCGRIAGKYVVRPCNADDCDHWITKPELCEKCLETMFEFNTTLFIKK